MPQGLAKTGVIAGFLGALDANRVDPEVVAIRDAAFAGNLAAVVPFAAARSSISALKGVRTPVFMMQGRRDFAFGLDQAKRAYAALAGPKRLWIGLHGHAPSSASPRDTPAMLAEGARWFDRFLRGDTSRPLAPPGRGRAGALARPAGAVRAPAEGGCQSSDGVHDQKRCDPAIRALSDSGATTAAGVGGVRLADRRGHGDGRRRLVAARRRAERAHARRQGDRRRRAAASRRARARGRTRSRSTTRRRSCRRAPGSRSRSAPRRSRRTRGTSSTSICRSRRPPASG